MTILIATAMQQEAHPFLTGATELDVPAGTAWETTVGRHRAIVLKTGVGLVNAAADLAAAICRYEPAAVLNAGAAGGLSQGIFVGDVVVGSSFSYYDADSTAFGYTAGQIPGMPEKYDADERLLELSSSVHHDYKIRKGTIVSGNSFVADHLVGDVRATFPSALAADMESAAIAQVTRAYNVPFLAVRAISDLCGPTASRDFSMSLDEAATRAAAVTTAIIEAY